MEARIIDNYLAPVLVPAIMSISIYKQLNIKDNDRADWELNYGLITIGTAVSAVTELTGFGLMSIWNCSVFLLTSVIIGWMTNQTQRNPCVQTLVVTLLILCHTQLCHKIRNDLLSRAKRTFTSGEAILFAQLVSAASMKWLLNMIKLYQPRSELVRTSLTTEIVLNIAICMLVFTFLPAYYFIKGRATILRYTVVGLGVVASYVSVKSVIASRSKLDPFTWLIDFIFADHRRISLFSLWLSTLTACVSFSLSWSRMGGRTNSLVRKIFHLAACVVFMTGYHQDAEFTRFAAGGILTVMCLLELIRTWGLEPIGVHLENVCKALRGKWDNKYLTLSHIYLLVGTFLPLLLLPTELQQNKLLMSSGAIAVGVGDTAAALVGTYMGRTNFRNGKTLEGIIGNIFAMILFKLLWIGYSLEPIGEFSFFLAAIVTSLVEAMTENCDNLILPLVMMLCLNIF